MVLLILHPSPFRGETARLDACGPQHGGTRTHHSRNELMNRAPVLFRVDACSRLGWESLNRCLSLAAALQRRRRPAYFLSQLEPSSLVPLVKRGGNEWLDADSTVGTDEDLAEVLQEIRRIKPLV